MTPLRARVVAAAATLALAMSAASAAPASVNRDAVDAFVTAQMDRHRVPGLALAVFDNGNVTRLAGFGDAGGGRPVTPDTPFVVGSISKAFTAVAVLQLVEDGLVDLDAPVRTYLPAFAVADADASASINVRHLLSHTSGLSELGYRRVLDRSTTLDDAVADLRTAQPTAPAGARFQYFNPNYTVLALLVETVSSQPYGRYVTKHIFQPLGMTRSVADPDQARRAGLAQGHSKIFGFPVARDVPLAEYALGYGHLVSTARDLSRFALAIAGNGTLGDTTILSPASVARMRTPPADVPTGGYGLGWQSWEAHGTTGEGHGGAEEAFTASLTLLPDQDRGYVWLINQQHLLDPVAAQLDAGLTDLLVGRQPDTGGMSMRTLGLAILAVFVVALAFTVRSFLRLRGWRHRARHLSTIAIVRSIAPHVVIPGAAGVGHLHPARPAGLRPASRVELPPRRRLLPARHRPVAGPRGRARPDPGRVHDRRRGHRPSQPPAARRARW